jgi:hypothetical protein
MILITKVMIMGFRSFSTGSLNDPGQLNVLVGKNSSGKSNFLRALSLFFNNEVEPNQVLSFQRDLFDSGQHRKKQLWITVEFTLPTSFLLRKKLEHLKALGNQFSIKRIWELDSQLNIVDRFEIDSAGTSIPDPGGFARQFLSLIKFRYIPNRTVPTDILRNESQALAQLVFFRMKDQTHAQSLMSELTVAATRMLKEVSQSMEATTAPLHDPTVTTSTLIQMLTMAGFQARGNHGGIVQDGQWGAGHQAFFLYEVLRTLDTGYNRFFGWRQATIWAVEEPESALHHELEIALASQFRLWTQDPRYRLQVFLTTHSAIFAMAADKGSWVELRDSSSNLSEMPVQSLVKASETRGVSSWIHPILSHPWNPVVLVEGPDDAEAFSHVASIAGYGHLRFVSLPALDMTEPAGGKDSIIAYLKRHQGILRNRLREAPLIVLFDWDVSKTDLGKAQSAYGTNGNDHVLRMDTTYCDALMGPDFKGIERFYPPRIVLESHNAGELVLGISAKKPYSISKTQLDHGKYNLLQRFKAVTDPNELKPLQKVLLDIDRSVVATVIPQRNLFQQ